MCSGGNWRSRLRSPAVLRFSQRLNVGSAVDAVQVGVAPSTLLRNCVLRTHVADRAAGKRVILARLRRIRLGADKSPATSMFQSTGKKSVSCSRIGSRNLSITHAAVMQPEEGPDCCTGHQQKYNQLAVKAQAFCLFYGVSQPAICGLPTSSLVGRRFVLPEG